MLTFLKLGGSIITDKEKPRTLRAGVLTRLMSEIAAARVAQPNLRLVLGHGSGSYGHVEAKKYGTRAGVRTPEQWRGFADVQHVAGLLNQEVSAAAHQAGSDVVFTIDADTTLTLKNVQLASLAQDDFRFV